MGSRLVYDMVSKNSKFSGEFKKIYIVARSQGGRSGKERVQAQLKQRDYPETANLPFNRDFKDPLRDFKELSVVENLEDVVQDLQQIASLKLTDIFHLAAESNHVKSYTELHGANVDFTLRVLQFAAQVSKLPGTNTNCIPRVHYASTASVLLREEEARAECEWATGNACMATAEDLQTATFQAQIKDSLPEFLEPKKKKFHNGGYVQSKGVSEQHILEVRKLGCDARIYRYPMLGFDSQTGAVRADDIYARLFRGMMELNQYPQLPTTSVNRVGGGYDVAPIDFASQVTLKLALLEKKKWVSRTTTTTGTTTTENEVLAVLIPTTDYDFVPLLQKMQPGIVAETNPTKWATALAKLPSTNPMYPVKEMVERGIVSQGKSGLSPNHFCSQTASGIPEIFTGGGVWGMYTRKDMYTQKGYSFQQTAGNIFVTSAELVGMHLQDASRAEKAKRDAAVAVTGTVGVAVENVPPFVYDAFAVFTRVGTFTQRNRRRELADSLAKKLAREELQKTSRRLSQISETNVQIIRRPEVLNGRGDRLGSQKPVVKLTGGCSMDTNADILDFATSYAEHNGRALVSTVFPLHSTTEKYFSVGMDAVDHTNFDLGSADKFVRSLHNQLSNKCPTLSRATTAIFREQAAHAMYESILKAFGVGVQFLASCSQYYGGGQTGGNGKCVPAPDVVTWKCVEKQNPQINPAATGGVSTWELDLGLSIPTRGGGTSRTNHQQQLVKFALTAVNFSGQQSGSGALSIAVAEAKQGDRIFPPEFPVRPKMPVPSPKYACYADPYRLQKKTVLSGVLLKNLYLVDIPFVQQQNNSAANKGGALVRAKR